MTRLLANVAALMLWASQALGATPSTINPIDYGVTLNGVTDDTSAWQATINAAIAQKLPIQSPCGTSIISGQLNVTGSITLAGGGMNCTIFNELAAAQNVFQITASNSVQFRDFTLECTGAGSYGFVLAPIGAANFNSRFHNLEVYHCDGGFDLTNAYLWVADGIQINSPSATFGFQIANVSNGDQGDSVIANSSILGNPGSPASAYYGIRQLSSGGLKIIATKLLGWKWGYLLSVSSGVATSQLQIVESNFDTNVTCIGLSSAGGTFSNALVVGNLCSASPYTLVVYGSGWFSGLTTAGNNF